MTSVEQETNTAQSTRRTSATDQAVSQAVGLIGDTVSYKDQTTGDVVTGTVNSVQITQLRADADGRWRERSRPVDRHQRHGPVDRGPRYHQHTWKRVVSDLIPNPALLPPGGAVGAPRTHRGRELRRHRPRSRPQPTGRRSPMCSPIRQTAHAPTFSKHALDRLARRGIDMNTQTLGRLTQGIQRAADKGARNSVVFVDGTAFVTSVQNNTVITAVTPEAMNSHVFTNIDSAVIA